MEAGAPDGLVSVSLACSLEGSHTLVATGVGRSECTTDFGCIASVAVPQIVDAVVVVGAIVVDANIVGAGSGCGAGYAGSGSGSEVEEVDGGATPG